MVHIGAAIEYRVEFFIFVHPSLERNGCFFGPTRQCVLSYTSVSESSPLRLKITS